MSFRLFGKLGDESFFETFKTNKTFKNKHMYTMQYAYYA